MTSYSRRNALLAATGIPAVLLIGCTNNAIDPTKVQDAIKTACGILVPATTIVTIISAAVGATVQFIVDLVCTGYMTAKQANKLGAEPKSGTTVHFPVVVNGKVVDVEATVQ